MCGIQVDGRLAADATWRGLMEAYAQARDDLTRRGPTPSRAAMLSRC